MRIGIAIEETWSFLHEIHEDLAAHHDASLFRRREFTLPIFNTRINGFLFRRDLQSFLATNDVVFFEWASELLAAATHLPKTCGIVTRLHRYEMYKWADEINWDAVDTIILVSEAKQREFTGRFPRQVDKTVVIPEAVSLDRFQFRPKPFNGDIGILCHLRPRKRVYGLILALSDLLRQRDDLRLHVGGGEAPGFAEYYVAVHELVRKLGLADKVIFYDHVDDPENWYHKIDVFISNSYSEGLQVSPMEAMASGCYCLSHHWDGADELLPPENLYFSDGEMVERILDYCARPGAEKRQRIEQLRDRVQEKFNVDQTKVQIRHLIEAAGKV